MELLDLFGHSAVGVVDEFVSDDGALDGLDPAAVFGEAAKGADGADDTVGGGFHAVCLFYDELESVAGFGSALAE